MAKFKIGDRVIKNPSGWQCTEFDEWGAGEGIGVIVSPDIPLDEDCYDVRWPTGRAFQHEKELRGL